MGNSYLYLFHYLLQFINWLSLELFCFTFSLLMRIKIFKNIDFVNGFIELFNVLINFHKIKLMRYCFLYKYCQYVIGYYLYFAESYVDTISSINECWMRFTDLCFIPLHYPANQMELRQDILLSLESVAFFLILVFSK